MPSSPMTTACSACPPARCPGSCRRPGPEPGGRTPCGPRSPPASSAWTCMACGSSLTGSASVTSPRRSTQRRSTQRTVAVTRPDPGGSGVRCMLMRGGTSKGAYFLADDLPADPQERNDLLLRIMGSPDPRQIDGIGGAHPLTSKVAVISRSVRPDADVDYLFLQVGVDQATVSDRQNCGNLLAGVGPFAVERGLAAAAPVRIHMVNSGSVATATFDGAGGVVDYGGDTAIAGVPGTAAAIVLDFAGTEGSSTGALLPTGHVTDVIEDVTVTCIDNGMPVVVVPAAEFGRSGYETVAELEADAGLGPRVRALRLAAGALMGLGDVSAAPV